MIVLFQSYPHSLIIPLFGNRFPALQLAEICTELFVIEIHILGYDFMRIYLCILSICCSEKMLNYKKKLSRHALEELSINGNATRYCKVHYLMVSSFDIRSLSS